MSFLIWVPKSDSASFVNTKQRELSTPCIIWPNSGCVKPSGISVSSDIVQSNRWRLASKRTAPALVLFEPGRSRSRWSNCHRVFAYPNGRRNVTGFQAAYNDLGQHLGVHSNE